MLDKSISLDVLLDPLQDDACRLRQTTWTWRGRASGLPAIAATERYGSASVAQEDLSDDDVHVVRLMRSRHTDADDGGHGRAASTVMACHELVRTREGVGN